LWRRRLRPRFADHRLGLVAYRRLGMADAKIMQAVQGLTTADLEAAWEYDAATHPEEIDKAIRANEEGDEGFVK
jgi:uncharacterized protein (DUF433 family)